MGLVRGFESDVFGVKEGRKVGWEKEYLGRVGVVYSVVERAVGVGGKGGLSKSEREAIGKKWRSEGEGLGDGEREAREIVEEESDDGEGSDEENDEEEEEEDDGWEGLMGGKSVKKTAGEKEVVKKVSFKGLSFLPPHASLFPDPSSLPLSLP